MKYKTPKVLCFVKKKLHSQNLNYLLFFSVTILSTLAGFWPSRSLYCLSIQHNNKLILKQTNKKQINKKKHKSLFFYLVKWELLYAKICQTSHFHQTTCLSQKESTYATNILIHTKTYSMSGPKHIHKIFQQHLNKESNISFSNAAHFLVWGKRKPLLRIIPYTGFGHHFTTTANKTALKRAGDTTFYAYILQRVNIHFWSKQLSRVKILFSSFSPHQVS